ncbi:hypothetical protein [Mesorhizobium sp.]|uniref:hypothetical protein n=1 Tax=Mesorhizobium sp. TaxID=1871066 RepID=UPI00257F5E4A|nr:hypothetical protein [Mesorhizobium sp.]
MAGRQRFIDEDQKRELLQRMEAGEQVHDRQLVHMLANMVLAAETRGNHVY